MPNSLRPAIPAARQEPRDRAASWRSTAAMPSMSRSRREPLGRRFVELAEAGEVVDGGDEPGQPLVVPRPGLPAGRAVVGRRADPYGSHALEPLAPAERRARGAARRTCTPSRTGGRRRAPGRRSTRAARSGRRRPRASAPAGVDPADDLGGRRDRSQGVRGRVKATTPGSFGRARRRAVEVERAVLGANVDPPDRRPRVARREQPRRHVRVVVELGDDHLVAGPQRPRDRPRQVELERGHVLPDHHLVGVAAEERAAAVRLGEHDSSDRPWSRTPRRGSRSSSLR